MEKLVEHTDGTHIYMKMRLDGRVEEIDVYLPDYGTVYRTTGDDDADRRARIIQAFNKLY